MQRVKKKSTPTKKSPVEKQVGSDTVFTWVNDSGGFFNIRSGERIPPHTKFQAPEKDVPQAFRDCIKKVKE